MEVAPSMDSLFERVIALSRRDLPPPLKSRFSANAKYLNRMINWAEKAEKAGYVIYPTANEIRWLSSSYELGYGFSVSLRQVTYRQGRSLRQYEPKKNRGQKWRERFDERKAKFRHILKSVIEEINDYSSLMDENPDEKLAIEKDMADNFAERYVEWYRKAVK